MWNILPTSAVRGMRWIIKVHKETQISESLKPTTFLQTHKQAVQTPALDNLLAGVPEYFKGFCAAWKSNFDSFSFAKSESCSQDINVSSSEPIHLPSSKMLHITYQPCWAGHLAVNLSIFLASFLFWWLFNVSGYALPSLKIMQFIKDYPDFH